MREKQREKADVVAPLCKTHEWRFESWEFFSEMDELVSGLLRGAWFTEGRGDHLLSVVFIRSVNSPEPQRFCGILGRARIGESEDGNLVIMSQNRRGLRHHGVAVAVQRMTQN